MAIRDFTDLLAWQKAHLLVLSTYALTRKFPSDEKFGLVSQLRRAAVSVSSNRAEGFGRKTASDKKQFYLVAQSSLREMHNQMLIARDLRYVLGPDFDEFMQKQSGSAS